MRPHTTPVTQPTPAERLRTIITMAHSMTVITDGHEQEVYSLNGAGVMGRVHLHAPSDALSPGHRRPRAPIRLELTDVAPTAVRDRLRARVTLSGLVAATYDSEAAESACMELGQAVLEDAQGRSYVTLEELQAAEDDPLATCEAGMLTHLVAGHPELIPKLLRLVEPGTKQELVRALPLAIDRYGITLRLEYPMTQRDVRLPFPTPVTHLDQTGLQIHALLTAARRASHRLPA
ncbi:DUF2470 domain-containing protein [Streptomyces sp. NPDC047971]|uniref:DUF2470 domain-containing protein n=1 Tax=Streptomyces sp. NPDC047971 TaxID=3154499 RepID=UPI003410DC5F